MFVSSKMQRKINQKSFYMNIFALKIQYVIFILKITCFDVELFLNSQFPVSTESIAVFVSFA